MDIEALTLVCARSPAFPSTTPVATIANHIIRNNLLLRLLLPLLAEGWRSAIDSLLLQSLHDLLVLQSIDFFDPVLHLFSLILESLVQLALQLDGLLLLSLTLRDLSIMSLQLSDDFLLLEFQFAHVPLDFLRALQLLIRLLLIVNLPRLLHVSLLLVDSLFRHDLLIVKVGEKLVTIQLLDLRRDLEMMRKPLLIRQLRLILLVVEHFFTIEEFFMELLHSITKLAMLHL